MAERAGYTVTMFLIDVSPSMGKLREVETPLLNGEVQVVEMTNIEWALQYVKLKVQEMIYNGRKTDQCGVILFGTKETNNIVHRKDGGYDYVYEFIPIGTPNAATIAKISSICPAEEIGDPIDALIVGIETQDQHLGKKKTWTRRMVLLTDGENPIELEDWEATAEKLNALSIKLVIAGIDFDDEEYGYKEEDKSDIKRANEGFYRDFIQRVDNGVLGNCALAIEEVSRPDVKLTKSTLMGTILRLGDVENHPEEAIELNIKMSKCTALARPKSWKKFARTDDEDEDIIMRNADDDEELRATFGELSMQTRYVYDPNSHEEDPDKALEEGSETKAEPVAVEKEDLVRGYKYGTSYVPVPEDNFPKLPTKKGMDITVFIHADSFRRDWAMGEVQYVWADPASPVQQVALSSIVRAMIKEDVMAIARWVTRDNADPKMGVLVPMRDDEVSVDYLLWIQMPFADDVRKYTFASLKRLINRKGELVEKHPYKPTEEQLDAMADFVDALDLMAAGEKDEEGNRAPWFDTKMSYNPALHRIKQALFHGAIVEDLNRQPLPPPHPEILKYFEPPRKVLKRARHAIDAAREAFNVKEVPKRVPRNRKDGHVRARDDGDEGLLLDKHPSKRVKLSPTQTQSTQRRVSSGSQRRQLNKAVSDSESETEPEDENDLLLNQKSRGAEEGRLPTPERSLGPDPGRAPGKIIGSAYPLEDFKKNTAVGDLVSKAVEDLAFVITDIISKPFSSKRSDEMFECMREMRKVSLELDEIDAWNAFLRDLKRTCLEETPRNRQFWARISEIGRPLSLISTSEAEEHGGKSSVTDVEAEQFYAAQD